MKIRQFLRDHWALVVFVLIVCGYLFVTSGLAGLMLANFPAPDRNFSPGFAGNMTAFVLGGFIFSVIRLFYPLALQAGGFEHGTYALIQLPLVLAVVVIAVVCAVACRKKMRSIAMTGLLTYMAMMLATNDLAFAFKVDHSNDFPIGRALDELDWRDKPTDAVVRRVAGLPLAEATFSSTDQTLPDIVKENMDQQDRDEAFILAYFEEDKWGRMTTYYVIFDPDTRERFSQVWINRPISNENWPNKTVVATGYRTDSK